MATTFPPSGLLQYLPAVYREDPFMGQFLLAFEKLLLGRADAPAGAGSDPDLNPAGLEEIIDGLARLYDAASTPDEFLPWLSKWTALSLRADMTLEQQRKFIAQIIQLYKYRGTQGNLVNLLELFLTATPAIEVRADDPPFLFRVMITLPRKGADVVIRQREIAQALIELEKPAHTDYTLTVNTPTLRIGEFSTVGVDTLLGTTT
ncbi:MAG TPA: phage tail protein [Pyrinomonadaceae bacterium]